MTRAAEKLYPDDWRYGLPPPVLERRGWRRGRIALSLILIAWALGLA